MPTHLVNGYDWGFLLFMVLLSLILFYQSWVNLGRHKFTKYGLDAIMIFVLLNFSEEIKKTQRDPKIARERAHRMGFLTLIMAFGMVYGVLKYLLVWIIPYIKN